MIDPDKPIRRKGSHEEARIVDRDNGPGGPSYLVTEATSLKQRRQISEPNGRAGEGWLWLDELNEYFENVPARITREYIGGGLHIAHHRDCTQVVLSTDVGPLYICNVDPSDNTRTLLQGIGGLWDRGRDLSERERTEAFRALQRRFG